MYANRLVTELQHVAQNNRSSIAQKQGVYVTPKYATKITDNRTKSHNFVTAVTARNKKADAFFTTGKTRVLSLPWACTFR